MEKYIITGGKPLKGEVIISGAKNAAVAIIPATILINGICTIENLPNISDVKLYCDILKELGVKITWNSEHEITVDSRNIKSSKGASESWLKDFIGKYANGNYIIHENEIFDAYGIIVLENIKTKQLDFVKITMEDVYDQPPLSGNKLLTGNIRSDRV